VLRATLDVRLNQRPTLLTSVDTSIAGWSGPAGVDGATVVANRLRVGDCAITPHTRSCGRAALLQPEPGCRLAVATSDTVSEARHTLLALLPD
jgi:hypothetical protein